METNKGGILDGRFDLSSVKKRFDRLSGRANWEIEAVARAEGVISFSFPQGNDANKLDFIKE